MFNDRNKVQRMLDTLLPSCFVSTYPKIMTLLIPPSPNRHVLVKGLAIQMVWKTCLVFLLFTASFCSACFIILSFTTTTECSSRTKKLLQSFWLGHQLVASGIEVCWAVLLSQGGCEYHDKELFGENLQLVFFESPKDFFLGRCVVFGGKLLLFWKMGWQKNTQGFVFKDSLPMLMLQKSFPKEESHESP